MTGRFKALVVCPDVHAQTPDGASYCFLLQVIEFFPNAVAKDWQTPLDPEVRPFEHSQQIAAAHRGI